MFLLLCKFVLVSLGQLFPGSFSFPSKVKDFGNRVLQSNISSKGGICNKEVLHGNGVIIYQAVR